MTYKVDKLLDRLRVASSHWMVLPILTLISLADYFVLFIPSEPFFAAALLGSPRRSVRFSLAMILGRLIGIALVFSGMVNISVEAVQQMAIDWSLGAAWEKSQSFFQTFGPLSLGVNAVTPFPMMFVTVLGVVAGAPLWQLELFAFLGLAVRYAVLTSLVLASHRFINRGSSPKG